MPTGSTVPSVEVKCIDGSGVSGWQVRPAHEHLPRRTLRYLCVPIDHEPLCLAVEYEPFFADTAAAAAGLRHLLRDHGAATAAVHSTWLNRPERRGLRADEWCEAVGGHEWWSKDVSWRFADSDLRVLAYSDPDYLTITLYAWGQAARALLGAVAQAWQELPKVLPAQVQVSAFAALASTGPDPAVQTDRAQPLAGGQRRYPAWHTCTECDFLLAWCWDVCPFCGTDAFLSRPALRCPTCSGVTAGAWAYCPACGHDRREGDWQHDA